MCEMYHGVFCAKDNRDAINESENNEVHTSQNLMTGHLYSAVTEWSFESDGG